MRSNVRKMWTALLAVLFAVAVGFGLWFAFAPAARPANVHAAEGYSLTLKSKQESQTLSSNSSIDSDLLYNESHGKGFIGVTIYRDGTAISSSEYITTMKFYVYSDEACKNQVDDFRPLSNETGSTFYRYVKVSIEVVGIGEKMSDNSVMLTVTAETLDTIEAEVIGGKYFDALTSFEDIAAERLEVFAYYAGDRKSYPLEYAGVYEGEVKENKACYGGYWIEYQDDPDDENDRTDCLEYGDTQITIWYREGNSEPKFFVLNNLTVNEAYIDAPATADSFEGEVTYDGSEHTFSFTRFNSAEMSYSVTYKPNVGDQQEETGTEEDSSISIKKTEAGSYDVKFSVKEGYQFRSPSIPAEDIEKDGEKIIGVTYHFTIKKATIGSVAIDSNASFKTSYTYDDDTITPPADTAITMTPETTFTLPEGVEALTAEWAEAELIYTYTGINGTAYGPNSKLPKNAGEYSWTVSLTGMNNFEDFTGTDSNGGSGSFVIEKKPLTVPSLESNELPYKGSAQSATAGEYDSTRMTFDGDLDGEERINVGTYHATFTLKDADNYKWGTPDEGSGVTVDGAVATVTWKIVQAENEATVSLEDWTYGTTAKSPSLKADFGASTVTYSYSGQTNAGVTYSGNTVPTEAGSYTVKATIAGTKNYKGATATDTFEVLRAPIGRPSFTTSTFSYNGQNQTPEFSAAVSGFTHDLAEKKDAGSYIVTATPDGNHQWNTANASGLYVYNYELEWTISPYQIGVEGTLSMEGWKYGGYDESANKPGGVELNDETSALLGTATATFKYEYKLSSEGSAYTTTAPTDAGDYTVRLTIFVNKNFKNYTATANFTIEKDELTFGDATDALGWTWGDNTIPEHNDLIPAATYGTNEGEEVSSFIYTYYKAENNAISGVALAGTPSDAGNYILRVSVSEGDNYKAGSKDYSFTVEKGQASISIKIEGADNWAYLDLAEDHAITVKVTVGEGNHAEITPQITYYTRGWNENGDWTTTQKPGDYSAAGYYYIGVEVADTDNYTGTSLGEDDTENHFTIHKKQISIPALLGDENTPSQREFEHDGNAKSPTINGEWSGATVTQSGYFKSDFSKLDSAPVEFGDYFVRFTLSDTQNYEWVIIASDQLPQTGGVEHIDRISGENNEYLYVAFRITGSLYSISVSHEGWTIGSGSVPVPSVTAAEGSEDALNSALALGVTVTFTYYFVENGTETEVATVTANNGTTMLGFVPVEVALKAGTYKVRVDISASGNQSYAARTALSATFKVSAYELQEGDVKWTEPSDLTYRGSEFTYDAGGNGSDGSDGSDEISATYKNWTYEDGKYQEATSNLLLSLPEGVTEIKNWVEGGYTLTAELPHDEANVVWGDNTSKTNTIKIEKRAVNVKLQKHHETYKNAAFEPFEAKEGTDYTADGESGVTGLISGDDLKITLTPSSDTDAGSYAWNSIAWSNDNYLVTVTNEKEEVFTIDPAPITVQIENKSSVYGNEIADLTYIVTGNLYDTADTIFSLSTKATSASNVGSYAIVGTATGENSKNYTVTFSGSNDAEGVYTITKRNLTITVTGSIAYGEDAPTKVADYTVNFSDALEGDVETLKGLLSITAGDYSAGNDKGNYDLTVSGNEDAASDQTWKNYNISYGTSTLTVEARAIEVKIADVTTTYGTMGELKVNVTKSDNLDPIFIDDLVSSVTDTSDPARYAKVFKLVLKDKEDKVVNYTATLDNGTYSIVLDDNFKNENYEITVTEGTYTVGRLGLSITLSQNLHEGETSPVYDGAAWTYSAKATYTVAGQSGEIDFTDQIVYYERTLTSFAETETPLDGAPVDAGSYWAVLPATAASGNFEPTSQVSTDFTIAQRKVDVVWAADNFTYDGSDQKDDVTAGYRAYHDGKQDDKLTNLKFTVQPEFKNAGTGYTFTAVLSDQNYKLDGASEDGSVSRKYQMKKAEITISVSSPTFTYGEFEGKYSEGEGTETDQLTYKVNGLFGTDTVQVTLSYSQNGAPVGMPENVADYTVSATIADHQNYTLGTVTPGTLKIEKRALTVTVDGDSIEYGEAAPDVYSVTLGGARSGEEDAIKALLTFDTSEYSAGKDNIGDYTVKASFGADKKGILGNYQYTVTDDGVVATCTLKVTPRKITVEIENVETTYGTAGTLNVHVTREDGTNNAILDRDLVREGGQVVSGIAQFANVFTLSLDGATLDRLLNVGKYTIVGAAVTTGENAKGSNYEIIFKGSQDYGEGTGNAGLYTVDPDEVTVNFKVKEHEGSEDLVYDGKEWTFTATAEGVEGEEVTFQVTYMDAAGSPITDAVNAGSYTVSVKKGEKNIVVDGAVSNYIVEVDQSEEFTIEKRTLTLEWVSTNVIPDEDGSGENKTNGYDSTLMELENYTTGTGMDAPTVDADGELKVTFTANGRTTYYVRVGLKDPLNYAWPENSANVSGENGKDIQISFSVNATTNNITFGLSGSAGSVDPVAEVFGTYGEEFKVYIAQSEDESPAGYNVVVYIDSIVKGDADTDYYYRFARDEAGITADTANTLKYDLLVDDLTTAGAGTYWMQVFALTDENSEYGIGRAYVKVTIGKKTITQDEINAIGFTTKFVYNGKEQKPVAIDLPEYLKVTFSEGATNVTDGMELRATFTIVGDNCEFKGGAVSLTRDITIKITPYVITEIYWDENPSFIYNGTDQSKDVLVYFVDVNDGRAKLTATTKTEGGFLNAGDYTFEAQVPAGGNYKFRDDLTITNTITMAKASVSVVILDQSGEYSGKGFELQTRYNIDGRHSYDTALNTALYKELAEKLELVIQDGAAINAGTYTITLKDGYRDLQNYEVTLQTGTLTITPKQLTFTWPTVTGGVYQGENPGVTLTGNEFEGFVDGEGYGNIESLIKIVYSGTTNAGVKYSDSKVPTEAGSYTVTVTLGEGNYTLNAGAQAYLVARADYSFTVAINGWTYNAYDATANAPSVNGEHPENLSVTYTYAEVLRSGVYGDFTDTVPTNAGSYVVRAQYAQGNNYNEAVAETLFTIEKAAITVKITFKQQVEGVSGWVNGWVYGTAPKDIYELGESSNPGKGDVTATYSTGSWSGSAIPTEVGEYTLTVTVAETNNYESGSASVEFKIVQASEEQLSFTVSIDGWTYGEEPHAPSVIWGGGLTGHPDQISPVYTYAKAKADGETYSDKDFSSTVPTNAGSYVVKATFAETDHYGELSAMCKFVIGKAAASIDTSGMQKNFTYNGRAQAVGGAVLNHSETTLVYSPDTVTAVGTYTVAISAAETANYSRVSVTVTVTVSRASAGFSVSIDDWTYGETPSRYTISGGSGGSVSVTYSGTTNAGVKYSSSKVPTEAGEYTITVVMGASGNFLGGTARDSFTIHRAKAEAELTLAGWMYGEEPNAYVLTPEFLRGEVVRVIYTDGTYYSEAVPKEVGSYTITVIYAETDNYLGGEVSCKFSIVPYGLGLTVTLEGWTYGDKANEPVVTGAGGIGLMYAYTGTANDGTVWNSNTAPEKAGSYTLTVTVIEAGNYTGESASTDFVIARRLLSAPAWDEEGMRELIEVCSGDRMTRAILGFDMSLMNAQSATAQFMFDGTGAASVTASIHGVYTIVVSLKDAANYGWADLNEGETLTGPVTLTWTLTERVISLLWLIILLAVLIVIALIVLIVLLKKGRKPDGTDTGKGDVRLSSVAPVGLLLVVAPLGEIIAVVVLGVVLAAVVIADIAVGVRNAKRAKAAENAQEPVPAYGDEAAAEGEAYLGTEVPADDGAEDVPDEGGMLQ